MECQPSAGAALRIRGAGACPRRFDVLSGPGSSSATKSVSEQCLKERMAEEDVWKADSADSLPAPGAKGGSFIFSVGYDFIPHARSTGQSWGAGAGGGGAAGSVLLTYGYWESVNCWRTAEKTVRVSSHVRRGS